MMSRVCRGDERTRNGRRRGTGEAGVRGGRQSGLAEAAGLEVADSRIVGAIAGTAAAGADGQWHGVPGFWTTIGEATVKYHAWGDGSDRTSVNH